MSLALCVSGSAGVVKIAAMTFTLAWTHSVEKTRWEERWQVTRAGLQIVEAAVEGSGAGMEPPPEAKLVGRMWRWKPQLGPLPELLLRRSDAVPEGWTLCAKGACRQIADKYEKADIVRLTVCTDR